LTKAINTVAARSNAVLVPIKTASLSETELAMAQLEPSVRKESAARITVNMKKCPGCDAHHLTVTLNSYSVNKKPTAKELRKFDKTNLASSAVASASGR